MKIQPYGFWPFIVIQFLSIFLCFWLFCITVCFFVYFVYFCLFLFFFVFLSILSIFVFFCLKFGFISYLRKPTADKIFQATYKYKPNSHVYSPVWKGFLCVCMYVCMSVYVCMCVYMFKSVYMYEYRLGRNFFLIATKLVWIWAMWLP